MEFLGFTRQDIRFITAIASFGSIICPIVVGLILDRVSVKNPASYGRWLRIGLFICFIAAGVFFSLLLVLEPAKLYGNDPTLTFSWFVFFPFIYIFPSIKQFKSFIHYSNENGGHLFVKRQSEETCANLKDQSGHLELVDCSYTCEVPDFSEFQNSNVSTKKHIQEFERLLDTSGGMYSVV